MNASALAKKKLTGPYKDWAEIAGGADYVEFMTDKEEIFIGGVVELTPKMAQRLLDRNSNNRDLRKSIVKKYQYAIEAGQWHLSPDPIVVGDNSLLVSGQHRSHAVIAAGASVEVLLLVGWPTRGKVVVVDRGEKRRNIDVLKLECGDAPTRTELGAMLCGLFGAEGSPKKDGALLQLTAEQLIVIVDIAGREVRELMQSATGLFKTGVVIAAAWRATFYHPKNVVQEFLSLGDNLLAGDERRLRAAKLREWMAHSRKIGGGGRSWRLNLFDIACRSIDAYCRNEPLTKLTKRKYDLFPLPEAVKQKLTHAGMLEADDE